MNITVEDIGACKKRYTIEIPANRVEEEYVQVRKEFQKYARVEGFRAGKVPDSVIEKKFNEEIIKEIKRQLIPKVIQEIVKERKLSLVSAPSIEDLKFERGLSMSFVSVFEVEPEFVIPEYKGITIKKRPTEVTEEELNATIEHSLNEFAEYKDIEDRGIQENDFAVLTYTCKSNGQPLKEIKDYGQLCEAEKLWVWIKPDIVLPGFTEQLIGAMPGDTRNITVKVPEEDYFKDIPSKDVDFEVKVEGIKQKILPELNDEFCKDKFVADKETYISTIKEFLGKSKANRAREEETRDIIQHLLEAANFELPPSHVESETMSIVNSVVTENQRRGVSYEMIEENKDEIFNNAEMGAKERVKLNFILLKIADKENIKVSSEELGAEIYQISLREKIPHKKLIKRIKENNSLGAIQESLIFRKVLRQLHEWAIKE